MGKESPSQAHERMRVPSLCLSGTIYESTLNNRSLQKLVTSTHGLGSDGGWLFWGTGRHWGLTLLFAKRKAASASSSGRQAPAREQRRRQTKNSLLQCAPLRTKPGRGSRGLEGVALHRKNGGALGTALPWGPGTQSRRWCGGRVFT